MSLKDLLIKNTFYYVISQLFGFILPLILTPVIITKIGTVQFGIYAILMGFTGAFGILDLGVSTSFIKYITEYSIKKETEKLNKFLSTGLIFYIIFSVMIILVGYVFAVNFIEIFNIDPALKSLSIYAFKLSLVTFFFSNVTTIFTCILFSTQNIHKTSVIGIFMHILNFLAVIYILDSGYGLAGLFYIQAGFSFSVLVLNYIISRSSLPSARFSFRYFDLSMMKQMFSFGMHIQISRIAVLLSEKFDEFLLGSFTNMTNVTYFNTASKVVKAARFFPLQIIPQMGTASSVLFAKNDNVKIEELFGNFTRYVLLFSIPVFTFIFIFSDTIISTWLGEGFIISAYMLKILAVGQLAYLVFSIPGNSILPSMGMPKYLMYEGLITLVLNIILTFTLVKAYGVSGAAIGTTIAVVVSSLYLFIKSCNKLNYTSFQKLGKIFTVPLLAGMVLSVIFYLLHKFFLAGYLTGRDKLASIIILAITAVIYAGLFFLLIHFSRYLTAEDKSLLRAILAKVLPFYKIKPEND